MFDFDYALNTVLPLAQAAYQPSNPALLPPGWSLVKTIETSGSIAADCLATLCPQEPAGSPFGIVARSGDTTAIAFRGTTQRIEWADNFACRPKGNVEIGFEKIYASLVASLDGHMKGKLLITGHSLGAALALLCADGCFMEGDQVVTFAGPRVGNRKFQFEFDQRVTDCYRIVNHWDVVPKVPLEIQGYRHVGIAVEVDGGYSPDLSTVHSLASYKVGLLKLKQQVKD